MSFATFASEVASHETTHVLPVGTLAGIIADVLELLKKWLPIILRGGQSQFHAALRAYSEGQDVAHKLPTGTIWGIILKLLPILLQGLLGGLMGGATPAPTP